MPGHGHRPAHSPADLYSESGVPADCFRGGGGRSSKDRPGSLRVSFAADVTMLEGRSPSVCSPVLEEPAPLVSPVVVEDVVIPEGESNGPSDVVPDVIPPPPGFLPFSWPIAGEPVTVERSGSPLDDGASPDVLVGNPDVEPPFSPIAQVQDSESVGSLEVELLVSPLVDVGTDSLMVDIRPVSLLPTVEKTLRAGSTVGAGCCSVAGHWRSSRDPSTSVAAGSGGPVPGGAIS